MQKLLLILHIETVRKSQCVDTEEKCVKKFYCAYAVRWKMCTKIVLWICGLSAVLD